MTSPISEDRCWDAAGDGAVTGDGHGTACARRSAWSRARMACSVLTISRAGTACRQHHSPPCLVARVPCEHCSGRWSAAFSGCSCQPGPFVLYASRRRSCMCAPRVGLACRACMDELNGCLAGSVRIIRSCCGTNPVPALSCAMTRYVLGARERRGAVPFSGFVKSSQRGPPSPADRQMHRY